MSNSNFISKAVHHLATFLARTGAILILAAMAQVVWAQGEEKAGTPSAAAPGASAESDGFIEDTPNASLNNNFVKLRPIIQAGKFASDAEKQLFDDYFTEYEFKFWTQKKNAAKIVDMRSRLKTTFRQAKSGQVYDRLNELALDVLGKKIKNKKYAPFFRVNAMLTIGELNATLNPLTPLPQALPVLLETLDDAQQLDAVKVAALTGIRRHVVSVSGARDPAKDAPIMKAALRIAKAEDSDDGKKWMRMQAIEILGHLHSAGANNEVALLLQSILTDKKSSLKLRCPTAEALGQLELSKSTGLKAADLFGALVQLMKDGCDEEMKNVKDKNETISPRKVKTYLDAVVTGLGDSTKGVASLKDADSKAIDKLKKNLMKDLLPKMESEDATEEDLEKAVEATQKELEGMK